MQGHTLGAVIATELWAGLTLFISLKKMIYLQHRRFLPENPVWLRKNHTGFPDNKFVRAPPAAKDMDF